MSTTKFTDDIKFKIDVLYGYKELKHFYRYEGEWLVFYGYSITYDRNGVEISRTEPTEVSRMR